MEYTTPLANTRVSISPENMRLVWKSFMLPVIDQEHCHTRHTVAHDAPQHGSEVRETAEIACWHFIYHMHLSTLVK